MKTTLRYNPSFYRWAPFTLFMAFIGVEELLKYSITNGLVPFESSFLYYLYPVKALTVACLLYRYRKQYSELSLKDMANLPLTLGTFCIGILVFILWINMDWTFGSTPPQGISPWTVPGKKLQLILVGFRIFGAVIVVPLMEELFWRSFLIRYIIDKEFQRVPIGLFTWPSFLITIVLFGSEHSFIYAGMMAGAIYNLLLYKSRSLSQCVFAHAVTNLALAIYVLMTGNWQFW